MHPRDLLDREGFIYQPTENPCQGNPCPVNSVCQNGFTDRGFRCVQGLLPLVNVTPQTEVTYAGREVNFMCKVAGKFNSDLKWGKLNGSLPDSRSVVSAGNLTLHNVTTGDSGSYVCTATSVMGTKSASVQLRVHTALKFITRPPSSVVVKAYETLNLPCSASSDLQPTISWAFDGNSSLPQGASIDASNYLIVLSANFNHGGNYTCSATNSLNSLHTNVIVYVKYPETCSTVKANISDVSGDYVIDPDGGQGEVPFTVYCDMTGHGGVGVTVVSHDSENRTHVIGFDPPGSYRHDISYTGSSLSQIKSLTNVSTACQQFIKYECKGSALKFNNKKFAWWLSSDGENMMHWGGATQGCACGMTNTCADPNKLCDCDKNDYIWSEDSGLLTNKSHLPVSQLRFGDTGGDGEEGYHTLGKLGCYGMN